MYQTNTVQFPQPHRAHLCQLVFIRGSKNVVPGTNQQGENPCHPPPPRPPVPSATAARAPSIAPFNITPNSTGRPRRHHRTQPSPPKLPASSTSMPHSSSEPLPPPIAPPSRPLRAAGKGQVLVRSCHQKPPPRHPPPTLKKPPNHHINNYLHANHTHPFPSKSIPLTPTLIFLPRIFATFHP